MDLDWKRLFRLAMDKADVLGLDIRSSAVTVVRLRKEKAGYTVTTAGIAEVAAGQDSDDHRGTNTGRAICQCLQTARPRTR